MTFKRLLLIGFLLFLNGNAQLFRDENWKFHFPQGSGIGLFLAVAVPLKIPDRHVYVAFNFEAHYILPDNATNLEFPPLIQRQGRGIDRKVVYEMIESKMETQGVHGKSCLLRTICETSGHSMEHNGVLGDILHIIFTPSSSIDEVPNEYEKAEVEGRSGTCEEYKNNCSVSFLNLISWVNESF